jgi:hypothetical protein
MRNILSYVKKKQTEAEGLLENYLIIQKNEFIIPKTDVNSEEKTQAKKITFKTEIIQIN